MSTLFETVWDNNTYYQQPFAAVVCNGYIYLFGQCGQMMLTSVNLDCLQADATIATPASALDRYVTTESFSINSQYQNITSSAGAAAVLSGASLCLLWNDDSAGQLASICAPSDALSSAPRSWYALRDMSGKIALPSNGDIAVTVIDDTGILVGVHDQSASPAGLWLGYYALNGVQAAPAGSNEPGIWPAKWQWSVPYSTLQGPSSPSTALRLQNYALGAQSTAEDPTEAWLAVTTYDDNHNIGYLSWLALDTTTPGVPRIGGVQGTNAAVTAAAAAATALASTVPLTLSRDPSGSIRVYAVSTANDETTFTIWLQPGNQPPGTGGQMSDTMGPCYGPTSTQSLTVDAPPVAVYPIGSNALTTHVIKNTISAATTAYPVSEAIFTHVHQSAMTVFSRPIGRAQLTPNVLAAASTRTSLLVAQGIFDGPLPVPGVQLADWVTTSPSFGDVKYGTFEDKMSSRKVTVDYSFGVESEGKSTWNGGGGAWKWAASAGGTNAGVNEQSYATEQDSIQSVILNSPKHPTNIVPKGTIFGSSVGIYAKVYRFLIPDPNGSTGYVLAPNAPVWAVTWSEPIGRQKIPYEPYAVTPGDITSYTREAWDSTMYALGYPALNYFENVILPNAYQFSPNVPFLEIPISITSPEVTTFTLSDSNFTESAWHYDASAYAGLAWDFEVDLFPPANLKSEGTLLVGSEFSFQTSDVTQITSGWGITVDNIYFPEPDPQEPVNGTNGVETYTIRLYLLPASTLWTQELRALVPETRSKLDPNAAPWRIVYEVYSYQLTNGVGYPPDQPPPAPTVVPTVNATDLEYPSLRASVWATKPTASYMVSFWNARGESQGPWSSAVSVGPGACPRVTIPTDPSSNSVTARRLLYRSLNSGPAQLVAIVAGNDAADDSFYDDAPDANILPSSTPVLPASTSWTGRVTGVSDVWAFGNTVAYAVTFTFAPPNSSGAPLPVQWSRESMASPLSAPQTIGFYAYPTLTSVPKFPSTTGLQCTGRNVYRTVTNAQGVEIQTLQFVGHIRGNTITEFTDTAN